MPAFQDITVKKADGTTNVVFKAIQRSAGDKSPARYEQQAGFPIPASRPQLSISAERPSGNGSVRRVTVNGVFPIYDSTTGLEIGRVTLQDAKINTPRAVSENLIAEGVHQLLNAAASATVKDSAIEGFAP